MNKRHLWQKQAILVLPLLFLLIFFFYPLGNIFRLSLTGSAVAELVLRPSFRRVIWFTVWQAAVSTGLTLLIGLPVAYFFARYDFRGKTILRALTTIPFVMPTVVVAAAFRALLGASGPLNRLLIATFNLAEPPVQLEQTLTIILLAHVFYNVTVVIRLVGGFWGNLNPSLTEAAQTLGASPRRAFLAVTLPLLRPSLISASLLIYLFTFTSFGVVLILGGPAFSTIETEIYRQYITFLRPDVAAALSLLQIVFTFGLMSIYARWQQKTAVSLDFRPQQSSLRQAKTVKEKLLLGSMISGLLLFLLMPLLALVWQSFINRDGQLTLAYYQALPNLRRDSILFVPPLVALRNSLGYALLTVLVAGVLGTLTAALLIRPFHWRRWLDPIFMLPLGASAVTLGFGYVVTFRWLRTSPLLVLIAHVLVAFPFVVRILLPVLQGIKPSLREAAAVLGASPSRVWREVDLPIVGRALLVASVFAFTVSMGEFGATSFIVRPNSGYLTIPIAIERFLGQPGALNFGQALAMSTILMLVTAVGFIAIERFRYADIGEF
ncbi:Thiamin ABC transporter, transmembrane component [hydrothermal vent metagenome]|uniref:Thiamin ABC transporter, transmembrane component n=1 Tax=hydrothermal vent metagenome TaxID=652676 RepID=A0A3B0UWA9_9ZZZZ